MNEIVYWLVFLTIDEIIALGKRGDPEMMENERIERDVFGGRATSKKGMCGRAGEKKGTWVSFEVWAFLERGSVQHLPLYVHDETDLNMQSICSCLYDTHSPWLWPPGIMFPPLSSRQPTLFSYAGLFLGFLAPGLCVWLGQKMRVSHCELELGFPW